MEKIEWQIGTSVCLQFGCAMLSQDGSQAVEIIAWHKHTVYGDFSN